MECRYCKEESRAQSGVPVPVECSNCGGALRVKRGRS